MKNWMISEIILLEDNLITDNDVKEYQKRSYQDLSSEFQRLYPRVVELIPLMYNRLTLVDNLSHREAVTKIYNDHQHWLQQKEYTQKPAFG